MERCCSLGMIGAMNVVFISVWSWLLGRHFLVCWRALLYYFVVTVEEDLLPQRILGYPLSETIIHWWVKSSRQSFTSFACKCAGGG